MEPEQLADKLRQVYRQDPSVAATRIGQVLEAEFGGRSEQERRAAISALAAEFGEAMERPACTELERPTLRKVVTLLLGREPPPDISAEELLQRLSEAMNTVFDMLNQVVQSIDLAFASGGGEETIRHVIGSGIEGAGGSRSLEEYLGHIKRAFLVAQESFKRTAVDQVGAVLSELEPGALSKEATGALRFGPLRKAEAFELYEGTYRRCRQWFESGRFMEDWLRGFEKNCQRISEQQQGGSN